MSTRSNIAALLRALNVTPVLDRIDDIAHALEGKAFRLAERLDPKVVDYDTSDWPDLQQWHDEVVKPQQQAVTAAIERMLARMDPYPIEFEIPHAFVDWSPPATPNIDGVKEAVRKAQEAGVLDAPATVDLTSFAEAAKQVKFDRFPETDVAPYMAQIADFVRQAERALTDEREAELRRILVEDRGLDEDALDQWVSLTDEQRERQQAPWRKPMEGAPPWRAFACPIRDCVGRYSEGEWDRYVTHWRIFHKDVFSL